MKNVTKIAALASTISLFGCTEVTPAPAPAADAAAKPVVPAKVVDGGALAVDAAKAAMQSVAATAAPVTIVVDGGAKPSSK